MFNFVNRRVYEFLRDIGKAHVYMAMTAINKSKYLHGYHGLEHVLKTLNTLHYTRVEPFVCDIAEALIFHDSGYLTPCDDERNTRQALHDYSFYNSNPRVHTLIKCLCYPYKNEPQNDAERLIRDCDHSMFLYKDHLTTLFERLLSVEFCIDFGCQMDIERAKESTETYLRSVMFYNADLSAMWTLAVRDDLIRNTNTYLDGMFAKHRR